MEFGGRALEEERTIGSDMQELAEMRVRLAEAESRAVEVQQRLRVLGVRLTQVEENERRRIARWLHDSVCQTLAVAQLKLDMAQTEAGEHARAALLVSVHSCIEEASSAACAVMYDICPPVLYELGLEMAVDWLAERMHRTYGMKVVVDNLRCLDQIGPEMRTMLFYVVRELLVNVAKHAQTARATIEFGGTEDRIDLVVSDQGNGFDVEATDAVNHDFGRLGLFSVKERIGYLGGSVDIKSILGNGTRVAISIPLSDVKPKATNV